MGQKIASLEIELAMATGGAVSDLNRFGGVVDKVTAQAIRDLDRIDAATSGVGDMSAATASAVAFAEQTAKSAISAAREFNRIEKSGESMVAQLDRQTAAFGKTASEIRAVKAETAALNAERAGAVELADRIRAAEQALYDKEFEAARRARIEAENASEAREAAATAEAARLRAASRAHAEFEARASAGAAAMREQAEAEQRLATEANQLRASIDPMFAAQQRFDVELDRAERLLQANAIGQREYAQAVQLARNALSDHAVRVAGSSQAIDDLDKRNSRSAGGMNAARQAMQGASYQVQDFITQISMGANPINAFAVQGAQLAGQFSNIEGTAGNVARFFMGPWGLAITAALMLFGPFIAKLWEGNNALNDAIDKLKKDAKETEATAKAKERFKLTQQGVNDAVRDGTEATQKAIEAQRSSAQQANIAAKTNLNEALSLREKTQARLLDAKAMLEAQIARATGPGGEKSDLAALGIARVQGQLDKVRTDLVTSQASVVALQKRVQETRIGLAEEEAKRMADPLERIKRLYDGQANAAKDAARAQVAAGRTVTSALAVELAQIDRNRQAAIKTEQDRLSAAQRGTGHQTGRTIGLSDAESIVRNIGGVITSTTRSFEQQRVLYEKYLAGRGPLAARPGTSDHEVGNALDIAKTPGMSLTKIRDAFKAQGVSIKQLLDEGTHFHVAWKKGADDAAASEKKLADAQQALAKQFDPAAAAANEYRDALAAIAKANLDPATATAYADAARAAFIKARAAAFDLPSIGAIRDDAAATEAAQKVADEFQTNVIQPLKDELALYGLVGPARAAAALELEKEAFVAKNGAAAWELYHDAKSKLIGKDAAAEREAESIERMRDNMDQLVGAAHRAGEAMERAFGRVGGAIGDAVSILAEYHAAQKAIGADKNLAPDKKRIALTRLQIEATGDLIGSTKNMFKEHSAAYRAMEAAEKAYRVVQFAMSVQALVQNALETAGVVTNAAAKATAEGTVGVAKQSQLTFPYNIIAMAATGAALVAAGIAVIGGGGGNAAPPTNTGTGTVLGDRDAQSDSIKNAIDALADVDTLTNTYARNMAASLRSIDNQIGGVAALVVRAGNVDASGGVTEGFKTNAVGSVLKAVVPIFGSALASLFGTSTKVIGSGLYGGAQTVGNIVNSGFDASYYSDVEKKKKFLGVTTGTKFSTQYSGADAGLENQFTLILRDFNNAIVAAAGPLGAATDEVQNRLNSFVVNIGKIDLQGLSGTEIQEKLTAVFGAAADGMASAAFPGIERFQKVGEGLFETLVRVASTVEAVGASLDMLGTNAQSMSIDVKLALADRFDSVADLTSAAEAYFEAYYSASEQASVRTAQMAKVFDSLGFALPTTLATFRQLVEAQDLTSAAGQVAYATLLQLAPAFADLTESMNGAKSAADIMSERQDLERQLLELRGDTAAIRAAELADLDESNRALQQQVWAVQDAQKAAAAADELRKAWGSVGDSIMDEVKRIRGLTDTGGGNGFAALMGQFNAATTAARGGDQDAAKLLPGLSQALLKVAADTATSRQELARIQAQTAVDLEDTYGAIAALAGVRPVDAASLLTATGNASQASAAPSASNDDLISEIIALREEVSQMRSDNNSGHAANAAANGKTARILENVTGTTGGDRIAVKAA